MQFFHSRRCHWLNGVGVSLLLLGLAGCSASRTAGKSERPATTRTAPRPTTPAGQTGTASAPSPPASSAGTVYDESFDPATLREPAFDIPRKQPREQVQSQAFVPMQADTTASDTSWVTVPGYQLQLLQTEDGQQAREAMKIAILDLDTEVQVIYEPPYYKVRAGRFVNRYEAERLQKLADEKGYTYAWVVRTPVRVRAYELSNQQ
ncbi:MAG: hypothetical protein ONB48_15540 [candidate division KSB1 bacterium]|nr:hypothetical protein [candidate division KSB1 bacterium]MDZ7276161.1 hypothetical protein [candidate division KSB1 bacterium]MDZ7287059.1 hypothetical protein [candidate division KSB1 bacterium]MDZ7297016.1 hypothetical protein [candidate division KSB1 bacterium]MDZ7307522.1 hypothetical protein [candidate division KSB1 bacterium]